MFRLYKLGRYTEFGTGQLELGNLELVSVELVSLGLVSLGLVGVEFVQGILNFGELLRAYVGIYLSGFGTGVAQDFLNVAKVDSLLQKVGCKTMTKCMRCGVLFDLGFFKSFPKDIFNARGTVLTAPLSFKKPELRFVPPVIVPE